MSTRVGCWATVMIRFGWTPISSHVMGTNVMICNESSSGGIYAQAGSVLCLLIKRRSSLPMLVKQPAFLGCKWMLSPFFSQHVLHNYFSSKTVPLHVMVMMIIFIVSCFTTSADNVKEVFLWRRAVLLGSPKWTACLLYPVQPSWALFLTGLISWGITSCWSS